jgi:hypothetical protein
MVVFLLCYSVGLRLPLSYCFVVDYHLFIQYFPSSHFAHVSVLLCLSITQVRIPSTTEHLCSATLTTTLPSLQPLANTLLAGTILFSPPSLFPIQTPYWGYKLSFGFSNPEDGTNTLPEMSVRNYHYSLCKTQKCAGLSYFAAEASNHKQFS